VSGVPVSALPEPHRERRQPAPATVGAPSPRAAPSPHPGGHRDHADPNPVGRRLAVLTLGALGVVYGDIGTSPLYALRECFSHLYGLTPTPANVYGVLSLIVWAILLVVAVKYIACILRADNKGEGGILALLALVLQRQHRGSQRRRRALLVALGLFGAALLYGDGVITPPVSVFGATEGLIVAAPALEHYVVPITFVILLALFLVQKRGTAGLGAVFGPVVLVWFMTIAVLGAREVLRSPGILRALNPWYGGAFFVANGTHAFVILGSVVLAITGAEALYADMGHFGIKPIRRVWFFFVFPALLLNYFGQGAFLLRAGAAGVSNPFFKMAPSWALIPLVILATSAACIASQAVISGAFSLTRQAVQLGYLPRIRIVHTSVREIGQIYIPSVNWGLMFSAIALVLAFRSSGNLAAAYGVAVTATMAITTTLISVYAHDRWKWPVWGAVLFALFFLCFDLSFFGANIVKLFDGGWFPLVVGLLVFTMMATWRRGRQILNERLAMGVLSLEDFVRELGGGRIPRVPGTAIFMSRQMEGVPTTLLHNIKHNKVVHQRVVLLTVETEEKSHLSEDERFEWEEIGHGVYRLVLHFGYMEDPDIPAILERLGPNPVSFNPMTTSYFLGRETLIPTKQPGMAIWREHLFAWLMRNSSSASVFFNLPANQVIELGAQVEL